MKNEKKKLNLNDLKVDSFITNIEKNDSETVKAGVGSAASAVSIIITLPITYSIYKTLAECTGGSVCGTGWLC